MRHPSALMSPGSALTKRQRFRPVPLLLAAAVLAVAAQTNLARGAAVEGAVWYLLAGLAFRRALAYSVPTALPRLLPAALPPLPPMRLAAIAGGLLMAGAAGWRLGAGETLSPALSLAVAGIIVALVGADAPRRDTDPALRSGQALTPLAPLSPERGSKHWWVVLALVTALGLALRLVQLDTLPLGIWYDEAIIGLEAARIVNEPDFRPLYSNGTSSPAAFLYFVAAAIRLFGQDAFALRLASALTGAATVPALALLLRELGAPRLALIAAFLLTVARWDITFSRLAMQGATTPFLSCLTLWLLVSGLRRGSGVRLLLAGAATGAGLLFYTAFLAFPLVLAAALVFAAYDGGRKRLPELAAAATLFLAAAAAAAMPFLSFAVHHREQLIARPATASVLTTTEPARLPSVVLDSLGKHVGMFQFRGDANGRHNLPFAPMLDPLTGMAAALGLAVALRQPRTPLHGLALVWAVAGLLPGVLSLPFEAPQGLRAIGAVVPALTLAALALDHSWRLATNALGPRRRRLACTVGAVTLASIAAANVSAYFIQQANDYDAWAAHSTAETIIARELKDLPSERYDVLVSPLYWRHPTVAYLHPQGYPLEPFDLASGLPLTTTKAAVVLYLEPRDHAAIDNLQRLYPEARCRRVSVSPARPETLMETCTVTGAEIAATHGLDARYVETVGGGEATGRATELGVAWGGGAPVRAPFQAFWAATLHAPVYGTYRFRAVGGTVHLRVDDAPVLTGAPGAAATVELAKGLHALSATATLTAASGRVAVEWQRPGGPWEPVPTSALLRPPVAPVGLTGTYFPNGDWAGPVAQRRVDWGIGYYWHLTPLPRPYTIEWTGALRTPMPGRYQLGLRARSAATLFLDGRMIVEAGSGAMEQHTFVDLSAGLHPLRVRYLDAEGYSFVYLLWTPPGSVQETVPAWALRPW